MCWKYKFWCLLQYTTIIVWFHNFPFSTLKLYKEFYSVIKYLVWIIFYFLLIYGLIIPIHSASGSLEKRLKCPVSKQIPKFGEFISADRRLRFPGSSSNMFFPKSTIGNGWITTTNSISFSFANSLIFRRYCFCIRLDYMTTISH